MKKIFTYILNTRKVIPFALISGGGFGFLYKLFEERSIRDQEEQDMREFRQELNVNAIKGLKQDAIYIKLEELNDKVSLTDKIGKEIATERDLATGMSFLIVGKLDDNEFLQNYFKLKAFLEKQRVYHTERVSEYIKETGNNQIDSATMDLIEYKLYPIVTRDNEMQLKDNNNFFYADKMTYENFEKVFSREHKSVGLQLDLTLPFQDLQQQIVGFSILQAAYIARRNSFLQTSTTQQE